MTFLLYQISNTFQIRIDDHKWICYWIEKTILFLLIIIRLKFHKAPTLYFEFLFIIFIHWFHRVSKGFQNIFITRFYPQGAYFKEVPDICWIIICRNNKMYCLDYSFSFFCTYIFRIFKNFGSIRRASNLQFKFLLSKL